MNAADPARVAFAIRDSAPADMDAIQAIYARHVMNGLASFEETAPDLEEMTRRRAAVLAQGMPHLVAVLGGTVLGYAYAGAYRTRSAYRYTVEDSVYVSVDAPRRGIGRRLLGTVIARCEQAGMRQMIAVIGDSGNVASIGLHAALGFEHAGLLRAVGYKHARWVDSVIMQRALGRGSDGVP